MVLGGTYRSHSTSSASVREQYPRDPHSLPDLICHGSETDPGLLLLLSSPLNGAAFISLCRFDSKSSETLGSAQRHLQGRRSPDGEKQSEAVGDGMYGDGLSIQHCCIAVRVSGVIGLLALNYWMPTP